jgi:hypothetical protein
MFLSNPFTTEQLQNRLLPVFGQHPLHKPFPGSLFNPKKAAIRPGILDRIKPSKSVNNKNNFAYSADGVFRPPSLAAHQTPGRNPLPDNQYRSVGCVPGPIPAREGP